MISAVLHVGVPNPVCLTGDLCTFRGRLANLWCHRLLHRVLCTCRHVYAACGARANTGMVLTSAGFDLWHDTTINNRHQEPAEDRRLADHATSLISPSLFLALKSCSRQQAPHLDLRRNHTIGQSVPPCQLRACRQTLNSSHKCGTILVVTICQSDTDVSSNLCESWNSVASSPTPCIFISAFRFLSSASVSFLAKLASHGVPLSSIRLPQAN